ncbi:hypothetical protein CA260_18835 [Dyella jiangningensis]|uniref:Peptidase A2 domain-containing protein n=2 Tax=Dyella jiangningensis TaxID=1379159 RepID=A0A328P2H9_9GAMM|nr:hypothetical protein CA260_18835 [Dyella jiangningensis]
MKGQAVIMAMLLAGAVCPASAEPRQLVPTVYEAGHFYATPMLATGERLRLIVDTGGGGNHGWFVLGRQAPARFGLATDRCRIGENEVDVVRSMTFRSGQGLPPSAAPCGSMALVMPGDGSVDGEDGQLGAGYLPGRIWTFDYPAQKLWLEPARWKAARDMHAANLGFPRDEQGHLESGFARIALSVAGESMDFLLDTGATARPTEAGKASAASLSEHGIGVASYIASSVFERWRRAHPSWRVIEHGDNLLGARFDSRLIEVPEVMIAGWRVGPVWFTERPDAAFSSKPGGMSSYMDQPVVGAVGGNVFMHFTMTVDYPASKAWFACGVDCWRDTTTAK